MKILFVCLGNICRSPAAEGVVRARLGPASAVYTLDSAGTSGWHQGDAPYPPMIAAAAARGIDLSQLRARAFVAADFSDFDLIIAMDGENLRDIEALRPAGNMTPVRLFLDYAAKPAPSDVPDPYYTRDFETTLDLIERAADGLLAQIAPR
jgi:protein-tyrosine phosphatase